MHGHDHHGEDDTHAQPNQGNDHPSSLVGRLRHAIAHSHAPHERVDSVLESSNRGIRALKLSLVGLSAPWRARPARW